MANHELGYIHRNELIAVMYCKRVAYKIRSNRRAAAPRFDHAFFVFAFVDRHDLFFEVGCYIRTFFNRTSHLLFRLTIYDFNFLKAHVLFRQLASVLALDDQLITAFPFSTSFQTAGIHTCSAPRLSTGSAAFTTTHRVIYRVHSYTTYTRANPFPYITA